MWSPQIEELSPHFRVIAPDLRGFGQSSVTDGTVTMQQFADDLSELLGALDIAQPVVFCGLSMGGYIAWQFWARHRDQLGALILCDTRAAGDTPEAVEQRLRTAERVIKEGSNFLAAEMTVKLFSTAGRSHPDKVAAVKQVIKSTSPIAIAAALRGMAIRPDMLPVLPQVKVPTLVICGSEDVVTPVNEMREMASLLPEARFVEVPTAGHLASLENPGLVNAAVREFLDSCQKHL
jgi:pimeloyl-ACP methyl ester carboxylesterase